jgi:hypothetical protein
MILIAEVRYCWLCRTTGTHDVEYHATPGGKKREDAHTCRSCGRRSETTHLTRAANQNGGAGDIQGRARRART